MISESFIREALRDCYDPEIPLNLVELGVVESVELSVDPDAPGAGIAGVPERYRLEIGLVPASRSEAAEAQLKAQVRNRMAGFFELSSVSVNVMNQPAWTPARITEAGRKTLKMDQPHFPILNNKVRGL